MRANRKTLLQLIAVMLSFSIVFSSGLAATANEIAPRASDYLEAYSTYGYAAGLGKVQIWFTVTGVNYMDEIGTLRIQLYESTDGENWTWLKTYQYTSYPEMLGYDKIYHSGHVQYSGTIGRYYKAYVCIWAGKNGDGDTRYMWTQPIRATLFAG